MKRISIITILDNVNFGTYLQVLALGSVLKEKGYEVQIIKYVRPFMTLHYKLMNAIKSCSPFAFLSAWRVYFLRNQYYSFLKRYFPLTPQYSSYRDLKKSPPRADLYLTGSDQVWNSVYNQGIDPSYYLDFAPLGKKRFAYGASIGMDSFPTEEVPEIKRLLASYTDISVREDHAQKMLAEIGFPSVPHVLDPTFLLNKNKWSLLVKNVFYKTEPYLIIYSVEFSKEAEIISRIAARIAKQKKLKIYGVSYPGSGFNMKCCDKLFSAVTPDVFISLFMQADYAVVSSFHGTSFAINFNKEFVTVAPSRFNSRVMSLLNLLKLQNRYLSDETDINNLTPIDYNAVNFLLEKYKRHSMEFIDRIVNKGK